MKRVLITGGAGFIGSNFIRYLLENDSDVVIHNLDALTYAGSMDNLKNLPDADRHIFIHGNICDRLLVDGLLRHYRIDTIVNMAAESHVDRSIIDPAPFIQTNITGTYTLLESAREYWQSELNKSPEFRFHQVSTDEVFGSLDPDEAPWKEDAPYHPNSPYAASKAAGDHLVRSYGHTYGLPYTISHSSNNYGPNQHPEKLIPMVIQNALQEKPIPVYGDGMQIRDWLHVQDHCSGLYLILTKGENQTSYNIGGNNPLTNLHLVQMICDELDRVKPREGGRSYRELVTLVDDRLGHDRRYALDCGKIERKLGWKAQTTIEHEFPIRTGVQNWV